jgi:hypothetical protein
MEIDLFYLSMLNLDGIIVVFMDKGDWALIVLGVISVIGVIIFSNCVDGEPRDDDEEYQLIIPVWYKRRRKKRKYK